MIDMKEIWREVTWFRNDMYTTVFIGPLQQLGDFVASIRRANLPELSHLLVSRHSPGESLIVRDAIKDADHDKVLAAVADLTSSRHFLQLYSGVRLGVLGRVSGAVDGRTSVGIYNDRAALFDHVRTELLTSSESVDWHTRIHAQTRSQVEHSELWARMMLDPVRSSFVERTAIPAVRRSVLEAVQEGCEENRNVCGHAADVFRRIIRSGAQSTPKRPAVYLGSQRVFVLHLDVRTKYHDDEGMLSGPAEAVRRQVEREIAGKEPADEDSD